MLFRLFVSMNQYCASTRRNSSKKQEIDQFDLCWFWKSKSVLFPLFCSMMDFLGKNPKQSRFSFDFSSYIFSQWLMSLFVYPLFLLSSRLIINADNTIGILAVGILWGCTNPFLNSGIYHHNRPTSLLLTSYQLRHSMYPF